MQILRCEYWEKVKIIDPNNLVFLDEMGVFLGLKLTRARSRSGSIVYDLKPFYDGTKITVVGAISLKKVVGLMTLAGFKRCQGFSPFY